MQQALLTGKSVGRQSNKTTKSIHEDIRDIRGTDRQDILNDLNGETERKDDCDLVLENELSESYSEHHAEWYKGDQVRDHFIFISVRERNQIVTSRLKIANDADGIVGKFEQHEPQQYEQVGGE